jgi:GT2 family glycosyltransferase
MTADITYFVLDYNPLCQEQARRYLDDCLCSLYENRNDSISSQVYVIDQGNESRDYKNDLANQCYAYGFDYVGLNRNLGVAGGINFGARLARSPHVCLVTSDTIFTPDLDTILLGELEEHDDIFQITPAADKSDISYQQTGFTESVDPIRCIAQELTIQFWKSSIFDKVGDWDERWLACFEVYDYTLRMFLYGVFAAVSHKAHCQHRHNTTYKNGSLSHAYGQSVFNQLPLREMWDNKWPGLDWSMLYDPRRCNETTRQRLVEEYAHNIDLKYNGAF